MATGTDLLVGIVLLLATLGSLVLAMWVLYKLGRWIVVRQYGERLGLPATEEL